MKKFFIFTFFIFLFLNPINTVAQEDLPEFDEEGIEFDENFDGGVLPPLDGESGPAIIDVVDGEDLSPDFADDYTGSPGTTGSGSGGSGGSDSSGNDSGYQEDGRDTSVTIPPIQSFQANYIPLTDITTVANQLFGNQANRGSGGLGTLVNQIFFVVLAIAVVLAVFAIIRGGYLYMTSSDKYTQKQEAKRKIQAAFGGLILAFGTVLILNTINSGITNFQFTIGPIQPTDPYIQNQETVRRSSNQDEFLDDGLQESDAFFSGENDEFADKILSMSDEELVNYLNENIKTEEDVEDYRKFLLELMQRRDYYQNGDYSNQPAIISEIERMNSLLNKFGSVDRNTNLNYGEVYASALNVHGSRILIGITNSTGQAGTINGDYAAVNNFNIGAHYTLFENNDTESIERLYEHSGGNSENNAYSQSIVELLNNGEYDYVAIESWVNESGSSIGITKEEDVYTLLN